MVPLMMFWNSCSREKEPVESAEMEEEEVVTNRIAIPATVRRNLGITFAKVERRKVGDTLRVPGAFELKPLARREYRLALPGQVRFAVNQLDAVEPGDLLFRFQSPEWLALQGRIDQARAKHEQAELKSASLRSRLRALAQADFKRADLEAEAAVLEAELMGLEAELDSALSLALNVLKAQGGMEAAGWTMDDLLMPIEENGRTVLRYRKFDWLEVRAIAAGVVESLALADGSYGEEKGLVLTSIDPKEIRFRALGLQSDVRKFQQAESALIVPFQSASGDFSESLAADFTLGLAGDPRQRTIPLYADPLEERPWVLPGVAAFLEVVTETTGGPVLTIPRSAVVKDGIESVFFQRDPRDPNKAVRVEADLGVNDGRWVEVKSGLGPNDEVVLQGAYELQLASSKSGINQEGGHFHADGTYHAEED